MCAISTIVSIIICLGSLTLPINLAIASGKSFSLPKNLLKVVLGIFKSIEALAISFSLAAGVDPSALPIESSSFTLAVALNFASEFDKVLSKDFNNLTK